MYHVSPPLFQQRGRVFGIIGMGRIGTATARRALAMGMDVRFSILSSRTGTTKRMELRESKPSRN